MTSVAHYFKFTAVLPSGSTPREINPMGSGEVNPSLRLKPGHSHKEQYAESGAVQHQGPGVCCVQIVVALAPECHPTGYPSPYSPAFVICVGLIAYTMVSPRAIRKATPCPKTSTPSPTPRNS